MLEQGPDSAEKHATIYDKHLAKSLRIVILGYSNWQVNKVLNLSS